MSCLFVFSGTYLDDTALVVGPPGALMPICPCSFHATCFGIFLIAGLGLGASRWLLLGVVCLFWVWSSILISLKPCAFYYAAFNCPNA